MAVFPGCLMNAEPGTAAMQDQGKQTILFEDTFDRTGMELSQEGELTSAFGYWFEGAKSGSRAYIRNGRLELDADRDRSVGTIWLNIPFAGDLKISFDVEVLASA
ncbi:MAG: hypothetical protein AB3N64_04555, partial [Puniceicoccaceae bacterium]